MTELEKSMLLIILKSQLEIETAVMKDLVEKNDLNSKDVVLHYAISKCKSDEIKRQINVLEKKNK